MMLTALGQPPGQAGVKAFQSENGLKADGKTGPKTRQALFQAYMDMVGPPAIPPESFLGRGADPGGKADYQGCGEFNPVLMFSKKENDSYAAPSRKAERDADNTPNRRVVIYLFCPLVEMAPESWPCPRAREGKAGCEARF